MELNASSYILNRRVSKTALTDKRVKEILTYVIDCYLLFKKNNNSKTLGEKGKIKQEDYFRNILVDEYLRKNKNLINISSTTEIRFNKEATETYEDNGGIKHDDKIDIHISDSALQCAWNSNEEIYYAIECKRLKVLSDTTKYIDDIKKFAERNYISTRIPFEGQIAFIENSELSVKKIVWSTNEQLKKHNSIITKQDLQAFNLHPNFESCYSSKHVRIQTNQLFIINHLLFDYSNILS